MTNLTGQWKKGKLPDGLYYIQLNDGIITIDYCSQEEVDRGRIVFECVFEQHEYDVKEVLAEVLSYDEWKQLNKWVSEFNALDVSIENTKLKELLEKWLPEFDCYHDTLTSQFCREVRQVLQEKNR